MKIAIFGDSFAVNEIENGRITDKKRVKDGFSYTNELSKKYDVTNFAFSGSGLYWSYQQYTAHSYKFDKSIFVASNNDRFNLKNNNREFRELNWSPTRLPTKKKEIKNYKKSWDHIYKKNNFPYTIDEVIKHVKWYYRHIFDEKQSNLMSRLIVNDIEKNKNTLVIPVFQSSYKVKNDVFIKNYKCSTSLVQVLDQLEDPYYNMDFSNGADNKFCHLSDENNKILFDKIVNWIENDEFSLHLNDFVTPSDDVRKYLKS